jgi:circadian clock protein KaiC
MLSNSKTDRLSTGVRGLDKSLKGGLPANRLYLLEGNPGTGKTTLGLQFLLEGVKNGETCLYITLSESKDELEAASSSHGWTLDGVQVYDLTDSGESLTDDSRYTVFHPSEVELDETTRAIISEVERTRPSRVVFDSLSEMRMLAADPLRFRRQVLALKQYFIGQKCTVIMLDDRTSDMPDRQLESIAHGVISLDYAPSEYGKQRHTLRIVKLRGVNFNSGSHDFNIETGGVVVFPRLAEERQTPDVEEKPLLSNDESLNALVGSIDFGTSTMVLGPAGVGKSTLVMMYIIAAAERGERSAIYLFDEGIPTLYARTRSLGLDLKRYVEEGLIALRQIKLAELTPGELSHMISEEVEERKTRIVVIDSVNGYLMASPQERFVTMQFHELLGYLNRNGVLSIMVVGQYGLVGTMQTPIDMSYLADTVMMMRYFEADGTVRQAISVLKKRGGKHERTIREYRIAEGGLQLGDPLNEFQGVLTGVPIFKGAEERLMVRSDEKK